MLIALLCPVHNSWALTWERDPLVGKYIAHYSADGYCPADVLEACGISKSECEARLTRAKQTCPAIITASLPAQLDDAQHTRLTARATQCVMDTVRGAEPDMQVADRAGDALWEKIRPRDLDPAVARENLDMITSVRRPAGVKRASLELFVVADHPAKGTYEAAGPTGQTLYLEDKPILTTPDVVSVDVVPDASFEYSAVALHYSEKAASRLKELTTHQANGKMAMLIDGKVTLVLAWFMPLESGSMFSNNYRRAQALELAQRLAP